MGLVVGQCKVFKGEVIESGDFRINFHAREGEWVAGQLKAGLLEMIRVEVEVAKGMDELAGFVSADLLNHHGEERVGGDVEGDTEEKIGAALVKLAAEAGALGFGIMNVELEKEVAGREGHFINLADVPSGDEVAA